MALKNYEIEKNGLTITIQLEEATGEKLGLTPVEKTPVEVKQAVPANKARKVKENK